MTKNQVIGAIVVVVFFLVLCGGFDLIFWVASFGENTALDPNQGKTRAERSSEAFEKQQAEWTGRDVPAPRTARKKRAESEERVPRQLGAYYPDEHTNSSSQPIDPLLIAMVGGAVVFGGVGAGAFLMMRSRDPDPLPEAGGPEPTVPAPPSDPLS